MIVGGKAAGKTKAEKGNIFYIQFNLKVKV